MKCPHCLTAFHDKWEEVHIVKDHDGVWFVRWTTCAACMRVIVKLVPRFALPFMVYPKGVARSRLPPEVPERYAPDYKEACNVMPESPKASAALSRRCLQALLREQAKVKRGNLVSEIQEVLDSGHLPSHLSQAVDAVRNIGNFAAHPTKSEHTGEILDVEPGEAEWLLDTLEGLFDFYFVEPAKMKNKREALNEKLREAGKPPMK